MKKFFLFIMVALMSIMTLNAENTRIYCKMSQDWWKVDGAAVGCHSWGTGQGTDWPGVRMTPVEGEADTWYIDLNTEDVQNVIFTRVNPSDEGNLDWGAKTKDLQIPTDGKNLFTITTTEAVWGDPGCDGEWSVYGEEPTPKDEGFGIILGDGSTVKGWKNEAQVDFLEYMIEANLTAGATFQLYDFANDATWTEANVDEASTPNVTINASNVYEVLADGHYTIYLKMYGPENNQVYIAYEASTGLREAIINAPVKKVMVDGILYIVKDNKVYTAQGF